MNSITFFHHRTAGAIKVNNGASPVLPSRPKHIINIASKSKIIKTHSTTSSKLSSFFLSSFIYLMSRPMVKRNPQPIKVVVSESIKENKAEKKNSEQHSESTGISIPIDLYKLLKARRVNSTEMLKRNYESLSKKVPIVGYSPETLESRSRILLRVSEILLDSDLRREYDQKVSSSGIQSMQVSIVDIPGTIALLQESGENEKVIELGSQWLNMNKNHSNIKDVVLSVALAYCDLASEALRLGQGLEVCCQELETALELCVTCDVSPELQQDISEALRELGPQYVLETLSLAHTVENSKKRSKGIEQLKILTFDTSEESILTSEERDAFMQKARTYLTASEQISIYESCPSNVELPLEELYDTAMAYVAEGYWEKFPQHITEALKVLEKVQIASMNSTIQGIDVFVEMGLCFLLLGESDKAMNYLGIAPGSLRDPDPEVLKFVQENASSEGELLTGVCALAEKWLTENIIPNYRGSSSSIYSLGEWFQSPRVSGYLRILERGKDLNLLSAASVAMKFSSSVAKGIGSAVTKTFSGIRNIFQKPKDRQKIIKNGKFVLPIIHMPKLTESGRLEMQPIEFKEESNVLANEGMELNEIKEDEKLYSPENNGNMAAETPMSTSFEEVSKESIFDKRWFKLVITIGIVAAVIVNGMMMVSNTSSSSSSTARPYKSSFTRKLQYKKKSKKSNKKITKSNVMDIPMAEEIVKYWHNVKSQALGSGHQSERLGEILDGNMLKEWKERADYVKQDGWHWQYKLLDLSVDKISVGRDGRHATIEANIKEKAELIDSGKKADWYSTTYTIQYDLIMKKQNWKITEARVLYET